MNSVGAVDHESSPLDLTTPTLVPAAIQCVYCVDLNQTVRAPIEFTCRTGWLHKQNRFVELQAGCLSRLREVLGQHHSPFRIRERSRQEHIRAVRRVGRDDGHVVPRDSEYERVANPVQAKKGGGRVDKPKNQRTKGVEPLIYRYVAVACTTDNRSLSPYHWAKRALVMS
jgi:hypothetical protein